MESLKNKTDRQLRFLLSNTESSLSDLYKGRGRPTKEYCNVHKFKIFIMLELERRLDTQEIAKTGKPIEDLFDIITLSNTYNDKETSL